MDVVLGEGGKMLFWEGETWEVFQGGRYFQRSTVIDWIDMLSNIRSCVSFIN